MLDNKDKIIFQQLDVIRAMTENNLKRIGNDFWGTPLNQPEQNSKDSPPNQPEDQHDASKKQNDAPSKKEPTIQKQESKQSEEKGEAEPEPIEALKEELKSYIGLESVKKEVNNLINMVAVHNMRRQHGLPTVDMSLHMVFSGNPGTGKTMIARLMARIYRSLGILSKGQLIEVDRSGLVAGYIGQTAIKTTEVIEKAKGGVLFIDEAYALSNKSENDFGAEAIDTLLKAMEDNREDLIIIVAGYDELMFDFIHSNPGLESRFNRYLHFEDYTIDEMLEILKLQCKKGFYELNPDAEPVVREYIMDENTNSISFGNARGVRNIFEKLLVNQANRLSTMENVTKDDLLKITVADVYAARGIQEEAEKEIQGGPDTQDEARGTDNLGDCDECKDG